SSTAVEEASQPQLPVPGLLYMVQKYRRCDGRFLQQLLPDGRRQFSIVENQGRPWLIRSEPDAQFRGEWNLDSSLPIARQGCFFGVGWLAGYRNPDHGDRNTLHTRPERIKRQRQRQARVRYPVAGARLGWWQSQLLEPHFRDDSRLHFCEWSPRAVRCGQTQQCGAAEARYTIALV